MSTTSCMKQAGSAMRAEDKAAIFAGASAYRKEGLKPDPAGIQSARDQLAVAEKLLAKEQAKEVKPVADEAPTLTSPTQADILTQQQAKEDGEKASAKAKRDSDKKLADEQTAKDNASRFAGAVENFKLGETADQNLSGQGGMFDAPVMESAPEAPLPRPASTGSGIADFGEKLGGARKDQAPSLKAEVSDDDLVSKPFSKVWPADEYLEMDDLFASAVAFTARAEVPAKPRVGYKVNSWVSKVKIVRSLAQMVASGQVTQEKFKAKLQMTSGLTQFGNKIALLEAIPREQWKRIGAVEAYPDSYRYDADGKQVKTPFVRVMVDDKNHNFNDSNIPDVLDRVMALLGVEAKGKLMQFEVRGSTKGPVNINKKGDPNRRSLKTFGTATEAFDFIKNNYDDLLASWEGVKERDNVGEADVRNAENRPRTGADHRKGKDVDAETFAKAFGFRGIEFGNWVAQGANSKERQGMLNGAYDALLDLAEIINVPPQALSLNGTLGLGFGSRGSGGASAHYEPDTLVINLTKTRGAGTLAHEWFHALDNHFSHKRGLVPMSRGMTQQDYRAGNYITYKPEPMMVHKTARSSPVTKSRLADLRKSNPGASYLAPENWQVDPKHPAGVRPEVEQRFADLVAALDASPMKARASAIDKGTDGYWSRIIERAARSFENYIITKMRADGYQNDYLANVREVQDFPRDRTRYPYLMPEEVGPIVEAFDALFSTIQTKETDGGGVEMFSIADQQSKAYTPPNGLQAAPARQQQLADQLAERLNGNLNAGRVPTVLHAVTAREGDTTDRARSLAAVAVTAKRLFGHEVVFVDFGGAPLFNGAMSRAIPGVVFIRVDSPKPHMAILGHELLHQLRASNPGLYNDLDAALTPLLKEKGASEFLDKLSAGYKRHGLQVPNNWDEELWGDVTGDNFMDPEFLQALGAEQPALFKRVVDAITKFLNTVIAKLAVSDLQPFGTRQYLTDAKAAREAVAKAFREFSGTQVGAMTDQRDTVAMSIENDYTPGTVKFNSFDTDERAQERLNRIRDVEEEYRLPNIHQAVPKDYVPKESAQKTVTIYRGVPTSLKDATIRPGDWVGLSKKYASDHGTGETGKSKVISIDVPADHVVWAGTDMNEWFYAPRLKNDPTNPDISLSIAQPGLFQPNIWSTPGPNTTAFGKVDIDKLIYNLQDGKIDLRRTQEAILKSGQTIAEQYDARLAETLYPGRVAYRSQTFLEAEAQPLLKAMHSNKVGMDELADYLHARGAEERNVQIAKVNPAMPDGGAGTNTKGTLLTTQAAKDYLTGISPTRKLVLDAMAKRVDAITAGTRNLLVTEGLEKQDTIDAWTAAYKNYVPMFRDEADEGFPSHPQGSGFAVKGSASKRAMGSKKEVTNILAHVLMQREAAITRAEKNRVALALYGQALSHPNPEFWTTIKPSMQAAAIASELVAMGVDPMTAEVGMAGVPTVQTIDPNSGKVVNRPNPMYRMLPGAIPLKVNGEDRVLMLTVKNERGARLAESLKNLDGLTNLDLAGSIIGKSTRWLAAVNTQYNPAFGLVNLTRDTLGGIIHLGNTELRGNALKVLAQTPIAILGIARELATGKQAGKWGKLYQQFVADGGQTGFKENFRDPNDRAKAIEKELKALGRGALSPGKYAHAALDLLDGFNTTLENAVRLSAYSAALDKGISRPQAARLGRELTVDFNRKGRLGREVGPLYAFFNASVQGMARTMQAIKGPTGGKIIAGGLSLGILQALMLAAAGYDDDEIPEFVKTRALIIPLFGDKKEFISIPYPLGLHVLPNTGRVLTELVLNGGKDIGKRSVAAIGEIAGAFNPLGGGNILTADGALKTIAPTLLDPIIEVVANKNFAGSSIEKRGFGAETDNRPGVNRARESTQRSTTGQAYMGISKAMNWATGGSDYEAGAVSPTPEMVRYLAQTVGGGVLREIEKTINASTASARGDKVKASQIPVLGRFYGEVENDDVQRSRYFKTDQEMKKLTSVSRELKKSGTDADMDAYEKKHPELEAVRDWQRAERRIAKLNKLAVETINDPKELRSIDADRAEEMRDLNQTLLDMEKATGKTTPAEEVRKAAVKAGWK